MREGKIVLVKVRTEENIADALTKAVDAKTLTRHVEMSNGECRTDRHTLAPELDDKENEHEEIEEEDGPCEGPSLESGAMKE